MYMIIYTSDTQRRAFDVVEHAGEVGVQFLLNLRGEGALTMLCAENEVRENAGQ